MSIATVPTVRKVELRKAADYGMEVKNWNSNPELQGPHCSHLLASSFTTQVHVARGKNSCASMYYLK